LSYLRQFKLGNQSILGASVYIEAAGSLVSSLVSESADGAHHFGLSNAILGKPQILNEQPTASCFSTKPTSSYLRCEIHTLLGLINSGCIGVESNYKTSFVANVRTRTSFNPLPKAESSSAKSEIRRESSYRFPEGRDLEKNQNWNLASISLSDMGNVSEYVVHPLLFENCTLSSAVADQCDMLFPSQMSYLSLSAPLKKVQCESASLQNYSNEVIISMGIDNKIEIHGIEYVARKRETNAPLAQSESTVADRMRIKARLSPASDEDHGSQSAYSLADFQTCEASFKERCQLVSSLTLDREGASSSTGPSSSSELDLVKAIVCEITGSSADEIDDEEPLIGAGLDSIAALELRTKLQDVLGIQLPVTLLQDHPSVASLRSLAEVTSQTLSSQDGDVCSSVISIQSEHFQPALYVPLLFKPAFMANLQRQSNFLPIWYPVLVYYIMIFWRPIFWMVESVASYLILLDGKVREYKIKLHSVAGSDSGEILKQKTVPLTHDDASYSHVYVSACLEFDSIVSELNLCNSLEVALSHFPALSGNLVRRGRNMYLQYGGEQDFVRVLAHEYNRKEDIQFKSGMIQAPHHGQPKPGWLQTLECIFLRFTYAYRCAKSRGHPCMKIYIHQNLQASHPQTLITVRWNHAVADGSTINKFIGAWGMADKGLRVLTSHVGPSDSLTDRQHALLAQLLNEEASSSLYFPYRSFWSPPYNSVVIRFTEEQISAYQSSSSNCNISRIDVVGSLLWLAMAHTCYPSTEELEDGQHYQNYVSWHPKISFLVDLRNQIPELQCFTGNLVRCTEPFCPMKDPISDLQMVLGTDVKETISQVGKQRRNQHFSMADVEEYMQLPGVPLCMQKMQEVLMNGKSGPCLLVNDLTSFSVPYSFQDGNARVSAASTSSDWSPGDASLMQSIEDIDLSSFSTNPFWFAHLKSQGNDITCALVTFT
jgi:acyl carrier protein